MEISTNIRVRTTLTRQLQAQLAMDVRIWKKTKGSILAVWNLQERTLYILLLIVNCVLRVFYFRKRYNKLVYVGTRTPCTPGLFFFGKPVVRHLPTRH